MPEARTQIALYRIPSLFGAIATVLLTYWAGLAFMGRRGAFLAAALMASCILLMVESRLAKTDAVLAACSAAAMGALARAYLGRGGGLLPRRTVWGFWLAVAVGILVKGPLVPMFIGLAAVTLSWRERSAHWLRALRPLEGLIVVAALVLPWFVAIAIRSGGEFFAASVGQDMIAKVGSGQERHWGPPGYYLVAFFATFWPGAILSALAAPFAFSRRREDMVAFSLAWIVPAWIIFEAVPTKLPHYVLPLYPAIAILTVVAIGRGFVGPERPGARWAALSIPFIPSALTVLFALAAFALDGTMPFLALPVLLACCGVAFFAWRLFVRSEVLKSAVAGVIAASLLSVAVFGLVQPVLRSLKLSPRLAEAARAVGCDNPLIGTVGYREPSLVFLTGTDLEMLDTGGAAADFLNGQGCRIAFVEGRFQEDFESRKTELGLAPALVTRLTGFNINSGRRLDIGVYALASGAARR